MKFNLRVRSPKLLWAQRFGAAAIGTIALAGCSSLGGAGPRTSVVNHADGHNLASSRIAVVDVTEAVAQRLVDSARAARFSDALGEGHPAGTVIGRGDVLDVSIWEAPPAVLFGTALSGGSIAGSLAAPTRNGDLPEQMVDSGGRIYVPFVGEVQAAGRTPQQIASTVETRLAGKAHMPQVVVRMVRNATADVTVVGEVNKSARIPLTPKGERLLDVLADVGGVKQPVGKTTIQITRGDKVVSQPLEAVIRDPSQNILLQPNDVVTVLFQPNSFTALGAIGNNAEIPFEGGGVTLAQALGRIGGLRDDRADIRGVFIFRMEDPAALEHAVAAQAETTPTGKVPVIYRVDLGNPASFFVAQSFPIKDKDVIYVSNAPLVDFQKFMNIVTSMAYSIVNIGNAVP